MFEFNLTWPPRFSTDPLFLVIAINAALAGLGLLTLANIAFLHRRNSSEDKLRNRLFEEWRPLIIQFIDNAPMHPKLLEASKTHPHWMLQLVTRLALLLRGDAYDRLQTLLYETGLTAWLRTRLKSWRKSQAAEAARSLAVFHDIEARERLRELIQSEDSSLAFASALALARIADEDDTRLLFKMLASFCMSHQDMVMLVLVACAEADKARFGQFLRNHGTNSNQLMALVLEVIGHIKMQNVDDILETQLKLPSTDERHLRALRAAGELRSEYLVDYVRAGLSSRRWEARAIAAWCAGRLYDTASIIPLVSLLADTEWSVRLNAANSLAILGETGKRALASAAENAPDRFARDAAAYALDRKLKSVPIL